MPHMRKRIPKSKERAQPLTNIAEVEKLNNYCRLRQS
jgi:hypothetical protein